MIMISSMLTKRLLVWCEIMIVVVVVFPTIAIASVQPGCGWINTPGLRLPDNIDFCSLSTYTGLHPEYKGMEDAMKGCLFSCLNSIYTTSIPAAAAQSSLVWSISMRGSAVSALSTLSCFRLQSLDLSFNRITIIHIGAFDRVTRLSSLDLRMNPIQYFPDNNFFKGLHFLKLSNLFGFDEIENNCTSQCGANGTLPCPDMCTQIPRIECKMGRSFTGNCVFDNSNRSLRFKFLADPFIKTFEVCPCPILHEDNNVKLGFGCLFNPLYNNRIVQQQDGYWSCPSTPPPPAPTFVPATTSTMTTTLMPSTTSTSMTTVATTTSKCESSDLDSIVSTSLDVLADAVTCVVDRSMNSISAATPCSFCAIESQVARWIAIIQQVYNVDEDDEEDSDDGDYDVQASNDGNHESNQKVVMMDCVRSCQDATVSALNIATCVAKVLPNALDVFDVFVSTCDKHRRHRHRRTHGNDHDNPSQQPRSSKFDAQVDIAELERLQVPTMLTAQQQNETTKTINEETTKTINQLYIFIHTGLHLRLMFEMWGGIYFETTFFEQRLGVETQSLSLSTGVNVWVGMEDERWLVSMATATNISSDGGATITAFEITSLNLSRSLFRTHGSPVPLWYVDTMITRWNETIDIINSISKDDVDGSSNNNDSNNNNSNNNYNSNNNNRSDNNSNDNSSTTYTTDSPNNDTNTSTNATDGAPRNNQTNSSNNSNSDSDGDGDSNSPVQTFFNQLLIAWKIFGHFSLLNDNTTTNNKNNNNNNTNIINNNTNTNNNTTNDNNNTNSNSNNNNSSRSLLTIATRVVESGIDTVSKNSGSVCVREKFIQTLWRKLSNTTARLIFEVEVRNFCTAFVSNYSVVDITIDFPVMVVMLISIDTSNVNSSYTSRRHNLDAHETITIVTTATLVSTQKGLQGDILGSELGDIASIPINITSVFTFNELEYHRTSFVNITTPLLSMYPTQTPTFIQATTTVATSIAAASASSPLPPSSTVSPHPSSSSSSLSSSSSSTSSPSSSLSPVFVSTLSPTSIALTQSTLRPTAHTPPTTAIMSEDDGNTDTTTNNSNSTSKSPSTRTTTVLIVSGVVVVVAVLLVMVVLVLLRKHPRQRVASVAYDTTLHMTLNTAFESSLFSQDEHTGT